MATTRPRTVRIDPELEERLNRLARERLIPVTFTAQVNAGLGMLVRAVEDAQARQNARLTRADSDRSLRTYRQLRGGSS